MRIYSSRMPKAGQKKKIIEWKKQRQEKITITLVTTQSSTTINHWKRI
jgi:hypothetical protein